MEDFQSNDLRLDLQAREFLGQTAKWAYFLSILGFIGIGFMVLLAFFMGTVMSMISGFSGAEEASYMGGFITVLYLVLAVLYFFPVLYLFKFASNMKDALRTNDSDSLTASFGNLKSHYKFLGIMTIVLISIYILIILFAILGGAALASM